MEGVIGNKSSKIAIIGFLLTFCMLSIYYFHFILKAEIVFTHLFYVPIILAGLWWARRGIAVAVFLALLLLISHISSPLETPIWADVVRAFVFLFVGTLVAVLNQKRLILMERVHSFNETLEQQMKLCRTEIVELYGKLEAIQNSISDPIIVLDDQLNILWTNKIATERYGDAFGKKCYQALEWLNEPCSDCIVKKTFEDGKVRSVKKDIVMKDGDQINFLITCSPVRDRDGTITSVTEAFHDISEYKRAEDDICKLTAELEKVQTQTNELAEKYAELEHLNALFVGRENRMTKLKEQIAELEVEIESLKSKGSE